MLRQDKIPKNAAFHLYLHCLSRIKDKNQSSGTKIHLNLKILIKDSFICTMNHPKLDFIKLESLG